MKCQQNTLHIVNLNRLRSGATVNEKALTETQTLRAGCSNAKPKISPIADPLRGSGGRAKI